jgi:hypothetical protein
MVVGEIKNPNQIIGISCSSLSLVMCLFFNTRGSERDGLILFLLFISIGLLFAYLFWGSFQNEVWQWVYMVISIIILGLIFFRIKNNYLLNYVVKNY